MKTQQTQTSHNTREGSDYPYITEDNLVHTQAYNCTSNLLFLNTLLKLNDTLISLIPWGGGICPICSKA